ncbi:MAG: NADH-quinone oxidoreductase subunit B family protein [Candidatus Aquicultorales bacterium]
MPEKLRTALHKFTCCAGCEFQMLYFYSPETFLEMVDTLDFAYFKMATRKDQIEGDHYDLTIIDGAISTAEDISKIKKIREQTDILVAIGACATHGGVPGIRDWSPQRQLEETVYPDPLQMRSIKVAPIDEYVKVDYMIRGCPPDEIEFREVMRAVAGKRQPYLREYPVCVECKFDNNVCLLLMREGAQESMCMGPVTRAGCRVACTKNLRACFGCRGPMTNPNIPEMVRTFKAKGFTDREIFCRFTEYAGLSPEFTEGARAYYERKAPYYRRSKRRAA